MRASGSSVTTFQLRCNLPELRLRPLRNVPEMYDAIAVFLVNTGWTPGEALSLRWSNIDLVNGFAWYLLLSNS